MPALASLAEFRQAVADFPAGELEVAAEPAAQAEAERSLAESGFLLLGEVHGVWENPLIIAALLRSFGLTSLALEWPAELAPVISAFLAGEALADDPQLWSGDGRITAGHLAVLRERAAAGPLELTLLDGSCRGRELVRPGRGDGRPPAGRSRYPPPGAGGRGQRPHPGPPHAARRPAGCRPGRAPAGVREIRIDYRGGRYYNLAPRRFAPRPGSGRPGPRLLLRNENLTLVLPSAREAVVPQRPWEVSP